MNSIDDVIDSCMQDAYDFGDYDQKRRRLANQLIQQGLFFRSKQPSTKELKTKKIKLDKIKLMKTESTPPTSFGCRIRSYMSQHSQHSQHVAREKENKMLRSRSNFGCV